MPRGEMPGVPQILTVRKTVDTLEENAGNFFFRRSSHHCHQPPAFPQPHESSRQREPVVTRVVLSVLSHFTTVPQIAARLPSRPTCAVLLAACGSGTHRRRFEFARRILGGTLLSRSPRGATSGSEGSPGWLSWREIAWSLNRPGPSRDPLRDAGYLRRVDSSRVPRDQTVFRTVSPRRGVGEGARASPAPRSPTGSGRKRRRRGPRMRSYPPYRPKRRLNPSSRVTRAP